MLGLGDLKQTRFYQEAFADGEKIGEQQTKLAAVQRMAKSGLKEKQIAQFLELPVEEVRAIVQQVKPSNSRRKR